MSANPTPLPSTVAAQQAALTPYYGLVYLSLAAAAYTDNPHRCQQFVVNDITKLIESPATFPALPAANQTLPAANVQGLEGSWKITWVPQYSPSDYANLMFAAAFYDAQSQPVLMAISIRGTDISAGGAGILQQLREDVTAGTLNTWNDISGVPPAKLPSRCAIADPLKQAPKIATGSCAGFHDLMAFIAPYMVDMGNLQAPGLNIADYVGQFVAAYPQCPVVVTGHSLGGCQATVLALYLKSLYPNAIIAPNPFAPPTAGNGDFASAWQSAFTDGSDLLANIWINPADLFPRVFEDMSSLYGLWDSPGYEWPSGHTKDGYGPPVDAALKGLLDLIISGGTLLHDHYQQLQVNSPIKLTTTMPDLDATLLPFMSRNGLKPDQLWLGMLMWQHFPPCYFGQMSTQLQSTVIYFPLVENVQCPPTPAPNPTPNAH